jgi:hypothetical protein
LEVAKQWIKKGYPITKVLEILEINRSTYYDQQNGKVEEKTVGVGRPPPGYSLANSAYCHCSPFLSHLIIGSHHIRKCFYCLSIYFCTNPLTIFGLLLPSLNSLEFEGTTFGESGFGIIGGFDGVVFIVKRKSLF